MSYSQNEADMLREVESIRSDLLDIARQRDEALETISKLTRLLLHGIKFARQGVRYTKKGALPYSQRDWPLAVKGWAIEAEKLIKDN